MIVFYAAQLIFTQPNIIFHCSAGYSPQLIAQTKGKTDSSNDKRWVNLIDGVKNKELRFQMRRVDIKDGIFGDTDDFINDVKKSGSKIVSVKEVVSLDSSPPMVDQPSLGVEIEHLFYEEFRIFILDSPSIYKLSNINNPDLLAHLTNLLIDSERAWAANVVLSKMMGIRGLNNALDSMSPDEWWKTEGQTGKAQREWRAYLGKAKPSMLWNPYGGYYQHLKPEGNYVL
jgi:hypothetical protein